MPKKMEKIIHLITPDFLLDKETRRDLRIFGRCLDCKKPLSGGSRCRSCTQQRFQDKFSSWTSGNYTVDEFIRNAQLNAYHCRLAIEWIPFKNFKDIEWVASGGYGVVYSATWNNGKMIEWDEDKKDWKRTEERKVALKALHNSNRGITKEFLQEIHKHVLTLEDNYLENVIDIYGITINPDVGEFVMVMKYAGNGSLRNYLNKKFNTMTWSSKKYTIESIISGLHNIHKAGLVHKNLHAGNIVLADSGEPLITDLGLCMPVSEYRNIEDSLFGVLPYVAPEILRGSNYTQASDIYSLGIVINEIVSGYPPHYDIAHNINLASQIVDGLRPEISKSTTPQIIVDWITRCWDKNPKNRPTAEEMSDFFQDPDNKKSIRDQVQSLGFDHYKSVALKINFEEVRISTHRRAIYTSRLLNFWNS